MQTFIPERDLNENQYREYLEEKEMNTNSFLARRSEYEKEAGEMGVDTSIYELIRKQFANGN